MNQGSHSGQTGAVLAVLIALTAFIINGCAAPPKEFRLDSAGHRVTNGFRLLDLGRIEDARREFKTALKLEPGFCEAYRGIGLSLVMQERFKEAFRAMEQARMCAKSKKERALAEVGFIRLTTLEKAKGWLHKAEQFFLAALDQDPDNFEAYYYMGIAYTQAKMLPKALGAFRKAARIGGPFRDRAKRALALVTKVIESKPQTQLGRDIALKPTLTRGEVAAVLVRELHLDDISKGKVRKISVPEDIKHHPYKAEIVAILGLGIQGMSLLPDGSFGPEMPVSRSDFATILAHIMKKLKVTEGREDGKAEAENPFDDIDEEAPYFADVVLCTKIAHLLEPDHGLFEPMELVSGADVLLAIRRLKNIMAHNININSCVVSAHAFAVSMACGGWQMFRRGDNWMALTQGVLNGE